MRELCYNLDHIKVLKVSMLKNKPVILQSYAPKINENFHKPLNLKTYIL